MPAASSMRAALVLPDDSFLAISFIVGPGDAPDRAATVRDRMPATRLALALANAPDPEGTPAAAPSQGFPCSTSRPDRKSTRLNSSHLGISYAVFCLKKKNQPFY